MLNTLVADFKIIFERDPAARNGFEVLFCYPGLHALWSHRFAHWLHKIGIPFIPRLISHLSRFLTGIEIHPGAQIGRGVFIDHGMGVVIGETAIVGNYALIYQNVTLGGTGKESGKRHPTLGENVVIGTGAKVLGNIELGNNVRVGAGSVVLRDVPADCTVVGIPGRIVHRSGERVEPLEHGRLPDSEAQAIRALVDRIETLEQQLQSVQTHQETLQNELEGKRERDSVAAIEKCYAMTASFPSDVSLNPGTVSLPAAPTGHLNPSCRLNDRAITEFLDGSGI